MNPKMVQELVKNGWIFTPHSFNSVYDILKFGEYNLSADTSSWLMLGVIRILFEGGSVSIKESLFDTMVTKNNIVVIEGEDRDAQNLGSLLSAFSRDDFDPSNFSKLF